MPDSVEISKREFRDALYTQKTSENSFNSLRYNKASNVVALQKNTKKTLNIVYLKLKVQNNLIECTPFNQSAKDK